MSLDVKYNYNPRGTFVYKCDRAGCHSMTIVEGNKDERSATPFDPLNQRTHEAPRHWIALEGTYIEVGVRFLGLGKSEPQRLLCNECSLKLQQWMFGTGDFK